MRVKLKNLGVFGNGAQRPKSGGTIPVFGGNGILGWANQSNYPAKTIVIGRVGAYCGSIFLSAERCWVSDNAIAFCPNDQCDPEYLSYYLKLINLNSFHIGSSQPLITQGIIGNIEVDIPSYEQQKRIAGLLSSIDTKIQNNNAICAELEAMAKLLYDYWFVQFDFPDENGKPYKSSGGKMVWSEELKREIPEGWGVTTIGDITICHDSERIPVASKDREQMVGDIPYYGATGIMGYVDRAIFNGDYVLIAEDGSVMDNKGHPIIQRVRGQAWINNHAHVLEPKPGYTCRLLMMLFKDIPVMKIKTGSIQMKINQENMNRYKLPAIPQNLRDSMCRQLDPMDEMLLNINQENNKLASLRDFLLPLLMNGQVTFKEADCH